MCLSYLSNPMDWWAICMSLCTVEAAIIPSFWKPFIPAHCERAKNVSVWREQVNLVESNPLAPINTTLGYGSGDGPIAITSHSLIIWLNLSRDSDELLLAQLAPRSCQTLISALAEMVRTDEAPELKSPQNDSFYDTNWSFSQGRGRIISLLPFP